MKKRAVVLSCILTFISSSFFLLYIKPAAPSDRPGNGWCCKGRELFQSSFDQCVREGGRFFTSRREASGACAPEATEPRGWCCKNGRVQHLRESDCTRGGGQFFDIQRDANEHCRSEEKGWCCRNGEIIEATRDVCNRYHGRYSRDRREARRACESQQEIWCCKNGRLFQTKIDDCEKKHGQIFDNQSKAKRLCQEEKIGWCCGKDGVFESPQKECQRRGGNLFNSRKEADRYCESRIKGWCCDKDRIFPATHHDCERKRGKFFENRNEAQTVCKEERIGWCCFRGELFEAAYQDCPRGEGNFFSNRRVALQKCGQVPKVHSLKPDTLVRGEPVILTLKGQKLPDDMGLDFGPDIFVESIKVDGLKRTAKVKIFIEPMAEETQREVILAYRDRKKVIAKVRVIDKIMEREEPSPLQPQQVSGDKLKKISPMMPLAGSGGMGNADLVVSVKTTNGTYQGDGKVVTVKILNKSLVHAKEFSVGFCLASQVSSKTKGKWLGQKKIHFLGGSNSLLIDIPWQVQTPVNPKDDFIVEVDIYKSVSEGKQGEMNNRTKPFKHEITPSWIPPAPIGKPVAGFTVSDPIECSTTNNTCSDGVPGETDQIIFALNALATSHPQYATMSEYVKITLKREDNTELLTIANNAGFKKSNPANYWYWLIPPTVQAGKYRIAIESTDTLFYGRSELFTIQKPIAISIKEKPQTVLEEPSKGQKPFIAEPLKITNMKIKSLNYKASTLAGGSSSFGSYASLIVCLAQPPETTALVQDAPEFV